VARMAFVKPEVVRIALKEGDWIDVKKFLTSGEEAYLAGAGVPGFSQETVGKQSFELDFVSLKFARMITYVVGWSFVDDKGNQTKPARDYVETLDPEIFKEIEEALDKHVAKMKEERGRPTPAPAGVTS